MRFDTFTSLYSVCAITITRLILSSRFKPENIIYEGARIGIFRDLEPLLGIIVACAPFFRTTFKVMAGHNPKSASPNPPSSGFARTNNLRVRNFRLQTDGSSQFSTEMSVKGGISETQITSPSPQARCFLQRTATDPWQGIDAPTSITVKRGWEVKINQDC